jgi:hypothetical protein
MLDRRKTTLMDVTLAEAVTGVVSEGVPVPAGARTLAVQAAFARAGGGTSCKAWVQTSLDGGATWIDVMCFAFLITTATKVSAIRQDIALAAAYVPTDGTLTDDTIKDGLLGNQIRVKRTSVGVYTGASSLTVTAVFS